MGTFNEKFPQLVIDYSAYNSVDEWRTNPIFVYHDNRYVEDKKAKLVTWKNVKDNLIPNIPFSREKNKGRYPNITLLPYKDGLYYHAIIDIDNHDDKYIEEQWTSREEFDNALPMGMKRTLHNDAMCLYWEHSYTAGRNAWCLLLTQAYRGGEIPKIAKSEFLSSEVLVDGTAFVEFHKRTIYNNDGHINNDVWFDESREFYEVHIEKSLQEHFEKKNSVIREGITIVDRVKHTFVPNLYYLLYSASHNK